MSASCLLLSLPATRGSKVQAFCLFDFLTRMDVLDAPVRVTWRLLGPSGGLSSENLLRIADRLLDAGVFFVLLDGAPLRHEAVHGLVTHLQKGCRISLVCSLCPEEASRLSSGDTNFDLFLDATPSDGALDLTALGAQVRRVRSYGIEPAVLFRPFPGNLLQIQDLVSFCERLEIKRLKLPNTPIDGSLYPPSARDLVGPAQVRQLKRLVAADPDCFRRGMDLEVHDLFLWEILHPGAGNHRAGYAGCQAANSLGHVTAAGDLYPCSSWPLNLGSLLDESLIDLWQSPLRFKVRHMIKDLPADCRRCRDVERCFGGCRGLALALAESDLSGTRDLMCDGSR